MTCNDGAYKSLAARLETAVEADVDKAINDAAIRLYNEARMEVANLVGFGPSANQYIRLTQALLAKSIQFYAPGPDMRTLMLPLATLRSKAVDRRLEVVCRNALMKANMETEE